MVNYIINKFKQFIKEHTCIDLFFFTKVDEVTVNSIPACTPLVLIYQCT